MSLNLSIASIASLSASGLAPETIEAAEIYEPLTVVSSSTSGANGTSPIGYILPYFDIAGQRTDFERTRLLNPPKGGGKYVQAHNTPSHVYLPPQLHSLDPDWFRDTSAPLFITEGEKKALSAVQHGILTIGLGGVDNWQNRTKFLTADQVHHVEYGGKKHRSKGVIVKVTSSEQLRELEENVAPELLEIDWRGRQVYLCYDTPDAYTNESVQRAAFMFGCWLRKEGAKVGIFYLDPSESTPTQKVGLDDWLLQNPGNAQTLLDPPPCPFPPPPSPRDWLAKVLEGRQDRAVQEEAAVGLLAALDAVGDRYQDDRFMYYYEKATKHLHAFDFNDKNLYRRTFGGILNNFGLRTTDASVLSRLANLYAHEGPVQTMIQSHRVLARRDNAIYFQLSDGEMLRITADDMEIVENGTDGILFIADSVVPVDRDALIAALAEKQVKPHLWENALKTMRLKPLLPLSVEETRILLTILFYVSPWLWRWRGMQLPLETVVAEAGSGKTFLYNLRMEVLTGTPELGHAPTDLRDFAAQVAGAPALWVCDNLGKLTPETFHRLSDELARLITDPHPTIKVRELYTEANLKTIPVECTFAITAIKSAFTAADITQRTIMYHLDAIPPGERDPDWYRKQLGVGREVWLAEHFRALRRFLQIAQKEWSRPMPGQQHRLAYFERGLMIMGRALGFDASVLEHIREKLGQAADVAVAETNPFIEALLAVRDEWKASKRAALQEVVDFVKFDPEERFIALNQFSNSRQLGNAFRANPAQIQRSTGVTTVTQHNQTWVVFP